MPRKSKKASAVKKVKASLTKASSSAAFVTPSSGWQDEFDGLWKNLVPPKGEASTKQGELIRCLSKLTDEAYRNGNINFDERHVRMCAFIATTLDDASVFSSQERKEVKRALGMIADAEHPDTSGRFGPHYFLSALAVRWCKARQ
ncbi:MAG: hypothetical protein HY291_10060 [Planctomycetes bacterium]|nr:hypothetical protein [Planctomycetota bacterium]